MEAIRKVSIIGAPLDLGQSRRGVDMGPSAIRYSGLAERLEGLGLAVEDLGNVTVELQETTPEHDERARYLPEIIATCKEIAVLVESAVRSNGLPLVLGGDHSVAMGTLAGLRAALGQGGAIWIDAHADMNRPSTSPSGNVHGMPLAVALGLCGFDLKDLSPPPWVTPDRVAIVGARDLDPGEKDLIGELGVTVLSMSDIDRRGIAGCMKEALEVASGTGFLHVSFDCDSCDPEIAPGVGTPVRGGLSYREAHLAMEIVSEAGGLTSLEVVEVNPILDHANTTGSLAVELIASALGARII